MKSVDGYEGLFSVTSDGGVWSHRSKRFMNQHKNNSGYQMVWFKVNGKKKAMLVHRLVAAAYIDNPKCKEHVNHLSGNKEENFVDNLEWATAGENMKHSWDEGLRVSSERHKKSSAANGKKSRKLSNENVISIRAEYKNSTCRELGEKYNVAMQTIHKIINNETYKDVK